jgi:RNA polymerase sigma factor (TIGR02999 family)
MPSREEVTRLLARWSAGDTSAMDELMPLVYDQLRQIAGRYLRDERTGHTLQATALVNEAFVRLVGSDVSFDDRVHFFALAARTMRRILVDHARRHQADKRGGGALRVPLAEAQLITAADAIDILAVHEALEELQAQDERKARVVELLVFGGLSYAEAADALDISEATLDRDFRMAKAWLALRLGD